MTRALSMSTLLMFACDGLDQPKDVVVDMDGDGSAETEDCDDLDPSRYPGAPEVCDDGVVQDCLGDVEGARAECRLQGALTLNLDADRMMRGVVGFAGSNVDGGGDLDGDALADLLIGVPLYYYDESIPETTRGGDALVLRGAGALAGDATYVDLGAADIALVSDVYEDYAADSVAWAGDVDGDGLDEVLVGAPSLSSSQQAGAGAAYLFRSSSALAGGERLSLQRDADLTITGEWDGDALGGRVTGVGDVEGDGLADILVVASLYGVGIAEEPEVDEKGAAYLLTSSGSLNSGETQLEATMAEVMFAGPEHTFIYAAPAGPGDLDGDGLGDIVLGAPTSSLFSDRDLGLGAVFVYPAAGVLSALPPKLSGADAELIITPDPKSYCVGTRVSYAGDVEGDGLDDLIISTERTCSTSPCVVRASLMLSSGGLDLSAGRLSLDEADLHLLGVLEHKTIAFTYVSKAGDVDGDGLGDLLVSEHAVASYLFFTSGSLASGGGVIPFTDADLTMSETDGTDWVGYVPDAAGDVNGDGLGDILIGTASFGTNDPTNSDAYLIFGRSY